MNPVFNVRKVQCPIGIQIVNPNNVAISYGLMQRIHIVYRNLTVSVNVPKVGQSGKKLTACFGRPVALALEARSLVIRPGELLTLMTDGVMLDTQLLDSLLREDVDLTALVASVLPDSNRAANSDDATMIVYRHGQ
jgi:serine/threonine protein phosphatase PrpC